MAFSFGAPAQQPQQQQQQQQPAASGSGFSFGGASTSQQPQQSTGGTTGGFSFGGGQQQQQQQGQQQQQPASTGGFSFGQPQQQQQNQQQQQPSTSGLFGSSTGGGFGANSGGLFGQQQQQQAKPGFSFGSSTTQQQPQQQQQQPQLGQSQFGQAQLGASQFGQSQNQQQQAQQQQPQQDKKLGLSLAPKMEQLRQAWDTNNLQTCRFMTYFYNSLPPGVLPPSGPSGAGGGGPFEQNPNFGRRQDAIGPHHDALWSSAVASNPSPTTLVPVLAVGYPDLKSRIEAQEREAGRQAEHLGQLRERLEKAERRETLQDSVRARAALRRQQAIHSRIMGIARKSHVLVPAAPGSGAASSASLSASRGGGAGGGSITKEEEQLRARLEACEAELEAALTGSASNSSSSRTPTATATKLKSRINDLWTSLATIKAQREQMERSGRRPGGVEWAVVDQKGVDDVTNILAQQQAGLNHLVQTLEEDAKGLETVCRGLKGVQLVGVEGRR